MLEPIRGPFSGLKNTPDSAGNNGSAIEKIVVFPVLLCLCVVTGVLVLSPMFPGIPALGSRHRGWGRRNCCNNV